MTNSNSSHIMLKPA